MKKIMKIFIFCLSLFCFSIPSFAAEDDESKIKAVFEHSKYNGIDKDGNFIFTSDYNPESSILYKYTPIKAQTVFSITPLDEKDKEQWKSTISRRASYNSYGEQWDNSRSIKIYNTVYYSIDGDYAKLSKVTGGYTRADNTVHVVSQSIRYGCNWGPYNQYNTVSKGTSTSWTITAPSSWQSINIQGATSILGAISTVQAKRSASAWTITLKNNPIENGYG